LAHYLLSDGTNLGIEEAHNFYQGHICVSRHNCDSKQDVLSFQGSRLAFNFSSYQFLNKTLEFEEKAAFEHTYWAS
jgi:hypothetical protein